MKEESLQQLFPNGIFWGQEDERDGNFMPNFKVQSQVYHKIGNFQPLLVMKRGKQKFTVECFPEVKSWLVGELHRMLHKHNP